MRKLRCGGCGEEKCRVHVEGDCNESFEALVLECLGCKAQTRLKMRAPRAEVDWHYEGGDGEGTHTPF